MPNAKITKRSVDAITPGERDQYLWDTDLGGFGLKVTPKGRKVYLVQYQRGRGGKTQRVTIGPHGVLTADQARGEAERLLASVRLGADPAEDRRSRRKESTISELANRYLKEHVKRHNKPSTASEFERIVETRIKPRLGNLKISDLTRAKVKEFHNEKADAPYAANRELACLSKMMSLAAGDWELREDNPCRGIRKYPERKREVFFSDEDLKNIGESMQELEQAGTEFEGCFRAIRLLATTGLRLGEVLNLRWDDFEPIRGTLRLVDAKAGPRTVSLGSVVQELLAAMGRTGSHICHAADPDEPLAKTTLHRFWTLLKTKAGLPNSRPHDFRHTAGTFAAQAGLNAFMIRDLLGHKTMAMTGRYVERHADPMRAAADAVANRVAAAMDGRPAAEVVDLKDAKARR